MSRGHFRRTPAGFCLFSAISGVFLAALLAQTRVLAFGSFGVMVLIFLSTDLMLYVTMKLGLIKSPKDWRRQKP